MPIILPRLFAITCNHMSIIFLFGFMPGPESSQIFHCFSSASCDLISLTSIIWTSLFKESRYFYAGRDARSTTVSSRERGYKLPKMTQLAHLGIRSPDCHTSPHSLCHTGPPSFMRSRIGGWL